MSIQYFNYYTTREVCFLVLYIWYYSLGYKYKVREERNRMRRERLRNEGKVGEKWVRSTVREPGSRLWAAIQSNQNPTEQQTDKR